MIQNLLRVILRTLYHFHNNKYYKKHSNIVILTKIIYICLSKASKPNFNYRSIFCPIFAK